MSVNRVPIGSGGTVWTASTDTPRRCRPVVFYPHPFRAERVVRLCPDGATLLEMVQACEPRAGFLDVGEGLLIPRPLESCPVLACLRVDCRGQSVPMVQWATTVPAVDEVVVVSRVPQGGGGGKSILRIFATLAVIVAAAYFAPALAAYVTGTTLATVSATAVSVAFAVTATVGQFLVNALLPPPLPSLPSLGAAGPDPLVHSVTGVSNQPNPFGRVPRIYGRRKVFPVFPGKSPTQYTEIAGEDQYLRGLFLVGKGPVKITDIKLGETSIDEFADVEYEVNEGWDVGYQHTLYTKDVAEDPVGATIRHEDGWTTRTSRVVGSRDGDGADGALSLDLVWQLGLYELAAGSGDRLERSASLKIQYRPTGEANAWKTVTPQELGRTEFAGVSNDVQASIRLGASDGYSSIEWRWPAGSTIAPNYQNQWTLRLAHALGSESAPTVTNSGDSQRRIALRVNNLSSLTQIKNAFDSLTSGVASELVVTINGTGSAALAAGVYPGYPSQTDEVVHTFSGGVVDASGGSSVWVVTRKTTSQVRINVQWPVVAGQYDVRVRKTDEDPPEEPEDGENPVQETPVWAVLRTITNTPPVAMPEAVATIAIRIRATDQLNGYIQTLSCIAESYLMVYDGTRWVGPQLTANPAWAYADILAGNSNKRPLPRSLIDGAALKRWADRCEAQDRRFNLVFDSSRTVGEAMRVACSAGRAVPNIVDGLRTVVEDLEQTVPTFHFTEENSWGYKGSKAFIEVPHALKIQFVNEADDYQQAERIIYRDGYSEANATKFESLPYEGITDGDAIWSRGRYDQAVALLRPEVHTLHVDREHLRNTVGDMGLLAHEVMLVGLSSTRIAEILRDQNGVITSLVLGVPVVMEAGKDYAVQVRYAANGRMVHRRVQTVVGERPTVTLAQAFESTDGDPQVGDLVTFGINGRETIKVLIKSIRSYAENGGLSAEIAMVNYNPAILHADQITLPPWDSGITLRPPILRDIPVLPIIGEIRSDESVLQRSTDGSLLSAMVIVLTVPGGTEIRTDWHYEVRYRPRTPSSDGPWVTGPLARVSTNEVALVNIEDGVEYELQARLSNGVGVVSRYTASVYHRVIGKSTPPPRVPSLVVDQQADGGRVFSWSYPSPPRDLAGFRIKYRAQAKASLILRYEYRQRLATTTTWGAWTVIPDSAPGNPNATRYVVEGLQQQAEYVFQLRAVLPTGPSDPTDEFRATTQLNP